MALGPCTVCETGVTAQILSRVSNGDMVNICDDCVVPFAIWLIEGQTGIPGASLTAMLAAARDMIDQPPDESSAAEGSEGSTAAPRPKRARAKARTALEGVSSDPDGADQPTTGGDATASHQ